MFARECDSNGIIGKSLEQRLFDINCVSVARTYIYIEDMRTKKVNECAVTSERIVFS